MKKILFVEDDPLIARIYQQKLADCGFQVTVAPDGLEALKQLPRVQPDLVVLDILMPKLNGLDVLRFIRQDPQLKTTRVAVFSNAFLDNVGEKLAALGVDEMLLKSTASPAQLIATALRLTSRAEPHHASAQGQAPAAHAAQSEAEAETNTSRFRKRVHRDFFDHIPVITKSLQQVSQDFFKARPGEQFRALEALARKIGFLTHMTGMAGCYRLAQLSSAFEALLFHLCEKPSELNVSSLHTIETTVKLLGECLARAGDADEQCLSPTSILVVDDDAVSNRALLFALSRYRLNATSVLDPFVALEKLRQQAYDIVLLDINLPGIDGIQLCEQMRTLRLQQRTPVIFMTSHMEFEPRARSILRAGDDLIAKPILPIELTVKVIAHSLKHRMGGAAA